MTARRDLFDLASRLVAIDTVSDRSNVPAVEIIADELSAKGFTVRLHRYERDGVAKANLLARAGPQVEGGLIISGHVDTVPFENQTGWTRDALKLERVGDRLCGRGIADMKGFLAQCVHVAGRIDRSSLRVPVVFLFTADEEVGCLGAERLAGELENLLGGAPLPRLAWIGEPTSYRIHHAHKSAVLFSVRVAGRGGHSGFPDRGVSAISIAGRVLAVLEEINHGLRGSGAHAEPTTFPEAPFATLNVGTIRGGTAPNVIADECELRVLYRSLPGDDPRAIHAEVVERLAAVDRKETAEARYAAEIEVSAPTVVPPMSTPRGTRLERVLREVTGSGEPVGSLLAADGCRFEHLGVATLICGPGEFDQAHQPNESLRVDDLERGADLVERVIARMCESDAQN